MCSVGIHTHLLLWQISAKNQSIFHQRSVPADFHVGCLQIINLKNHVEKITTQFWLETDFFGCGMYMGVSKNRGTPKWMVYNETLKNGWFGGTTIFGNIHIHTFSKTHRFPGPGYRPQYRLQLSLADSSDAITRWVLRTAAPAVKRLAYGEEPPAVKDSPQLLLRAAFLELQATQSLGQHGGFGILSVVKLWFFWEMMMVIGCYWLGVA